MEWAETRAGNNIPLDVEPAGADNPAGNIAVAERFDGKLIASVVGAGKGTRVSHFATCPHADEARS